MLVSDPLNARPIGERAVATTTASGMATPWETGVVTHQQLMESGHRWLPPAARNMAA
jgi:hypothetical protein